MSGERRIWRGVDDALFQFTTTSLADLHVGLMSAFQQSSILSPALNFDQTCSELRSVGWDEPVTDESLQRALDSLVGWGLLEATQDHAAHYATPEDFERKNLQWSLTRRGEAAMAGVLRSLEVLEAAVGLQSATLDAIGDALADLAELMATSSDPSVDGSIHIRLRELEGHQQSLVDSVRQFNGHLQRLIREDTNDDEIFADVKRRTVSYLQDYVDGVDRPQHRVAIRIAAVDDLGLGELWERALAGANLAPLPGSDPGPAWIEERTRRWGSLVAWFSPTDDSRPRIQQLLEIARSAIIELLRAMERRLDARRRTTSIAADFRRLATLFEQCPADADAHRLFAAAFGLWPARHAHKAPADSDEACRPTTSWLDTEPTEVEPSLRTTGHLGEGGGSNRVPDPTDLRAQRQRRQARDLADQRVVQERLHTGRPVRLSAFAELDTDAFAELLRLLGTALNTMPASDGSRRTLSADGRVEVIISSTDTHGQSTTIVTDTGVFGAPDLEIAIVVDGVDLLDPVAVGV